MLGISGLGGCIERARTFTLDFFKRGLKRGFKRGRLIEYLSYEGFTF